MTKVKCYLGFNQAPCIDSAEHHDIAVFSEDVSISALVHKTLGANTKHWADELNLKLQGREVLADSQADLDRLQGYFTTSGLVPAFTLQVISEGWVQDMIDSYESFKAEFLSRQQDTRALTIARSMQHGHTKMIPF
jgi:hypothetical protein